MYNLLAVGADPEFFLETRQHKPIPAIGLIGGTKGAPKSINSDGFSAVQEDNVMVEYNIKPSRSAEDFIRNHKVVLDYLETHIRRLKLLPVIAPAMQFKTKDLKHPQARAIGCSPDFSAWKVSINPALNAQVLGRWRTAGAHVHVSYTFNKRPPELDDQVEVIRMMDLALGVPAVLLDTDKVRRKFYGLAGAFRPKTYGVEYRTLSNFWIQSPKLMEWVFNQILWTFTRLAASKRIDVMDESVVQHTITTGDIPAAKKLVEKYQLTIPTAK